MKFIRFFTILALSQFFLASNVLADTSGIGCKYGNNVYTQYLGDGYPYGPQSDKLPYYSNSVYVPIYFGDGPNLGRTYRCGWINSYSQTQYWDAQQQKLITTPGEDEFQFRPGRPGCIISTSLNGPIIKREDLVDYSYNKTNKCSTPPTNVPLDDHLWILVLVTGLTGLYFFKKQILA